MSRKIKFRAKSIGGEWVYGEPHINCFKPHIHNNGVVKFIKKDTLSQCSEIQDKNGKDIYEHDIVKFYDIKSIGDGWHEPKSYWAKEIYAEVIFEDGMFCLYSEEISNRIPLPWNGLHSWEEVKEQLGCSDTDEEIIIGADGNVIDERVIGIEIVDNIIDNPNFWEE